MENRNNKGSNMFPYEISSFINHRIVSEARKNYVHTKYYIVEYYVLNHCQQQWIEEIVNFVVISHTRTKPKIKIQNYRYFTGTKTYNWRFGI